MLAVSLFALAACFALSSLSKSSFMWTGILAFGLAVSFGLSEVNGHAMIWVVDLSMFLAMIGSRHEINRDWQDGVVVLQGLLTTLYITYAVFAERVTWLIDPLIDAGNILYLVQLALVGFGGAANSIRNYRYIRYQRKSGNRLPWFRTAWRMT